MKLLIDTSVLVPCFVKPHPNHTRAAPWLRKAKAGEFELVLCSHCLAELYNILSKLAIQPRPRPQSILRAIEEDLLPVAEIVSLSKSDYLNTLKEAAKTGLIGGSIYDALIVTAAKKANVDRILTFNIRHFQRVWPEGIEKISAP